MREIMLDPELRASLLDEGLHRSPAREQLLAVEVKSRSLVRVSSREDDELYSNRAEHTMMAVEQERLIHRMHWLARVIFGFAVVTGRLARRECWAVGLDWAKCDLVTPPLAC